MNTKVLHRGFAALAFILALIVYLSTVQPSVPFWDCAEFSAAAIWQQVPHPPGAPLFLLLGKLFHTLIPFGDPAWRVNLVAVVSSSFNALFVFLISVKIIEHFKRERVKDINEALAVYSSALIGAAALVFSDTHWFNAVESEVYATSTTFVALIMWLIMKWNEKADDAGSEKYLLLIAYLIGLSTGVHLLAVLTVFSIALIVYFRKYKFQWKSFIIMGAMTLGVFWLIYPFVVKWIPALLAGHSATRGDTREYGIEDSTFLTIIAVGIIIAAAFGLYWAYKNKKDILSLVCASFLLIILGYTTYTQILLRSNANPPMNENSPKDFSSLASYLGREQYGDAPMWPRRFQTEGYFVQNYRKRDAQGNYIYGEWNEPGRKSIRRKDGQGVSVTDWTGRINSSGEFAYMWKYQIMHMYFRYFGWNFIGRASDVQDAGVASWSTTQEIQTLNHKSGYKELFPIQFYWLPFLFGLFGLIFHFNRDPKMALAFLIAFLLMGVLMALAQNQQEPQPRERDYFYSGSFLVWCIWIGIGAYGAIHGITKEKFSKLTIFAIFAIAILAVPVNMAVSGWKMHSRAGNYLPFDYSYNILQSTEMDAILFTNGDNDTFPLWYIQDVAGVRRDVRVVNLSLGNTLWYIDQLKNQMPWGAKKIPLSFPDESLRVTEEDPRALSFDFKAPYEVQIPVSSDILAKYTDDPEVIARGYMSFTFKGKPYGDVDGETIHLIRVQDKLVLDILQQTKFERPVYFSNTVGGDAWAGLERFFRHEGMAMRICPVPQTEGQAEVIDPEIMEQCLMNVNNSSEFALEPRYGFKFRNLHNDDVYYDEVHRRLMNTYRHLYTLLANYRLVEQNDKQATKEVLDQMNEMISVEQFPLNFDQEFTIAQLYKEAGDEENFNKFAELCINSCMDLIQNPHLGRDAVYYEAVGRYLGPHRYASQLYKLRGEYQAAKDVLQQLLMFAEQVIAQSNFTQQEQQRIVFNLADIKTSIDEVTIEEVLDKQGPKAALDTAQSLVDKYMQSEDRNQQVLARFIIMKVNEIKRKYPELAAEDESVLEIQ